MPKKIVDAYDEDGDLLYSYPIVLNDWSRQVTDEDFVEEAKSCHSEDGLSPSLVDKWVVRDSGPNDP